MEKLETKFVFDRDEFNRRVKIELYEGMEEEIEGLLEKAVPLLRPKSLYREMGIGRRGMRPETHEVLMSRTEQRMRAGEHSTFEPNEIGVSVFYIGNQIFDDPVVTVHLEKLTRVFPYVSTCGTELEEMAASTVDMLEIYWLDALKQMAMDQAFSHLLRTVKENCGYEKIYSLNPGSSTCREAWDMENQKKIFALLPEAGDAAGVKLTESLLMHPNKTVSGLMFESDKDFVGCRECDNIDCPNRRMIHDGAIIS